MRKPYWEIILVVMLLLLSITFSCYALEYEPTPPRNAGLLGTLNIPVQGNGTEFYLNQDNEQITLPDGVITDCHAINTKWTFNFDSPESDMPTLYEELCNAKCIPKPDIPASAYAAHQYEALELTVQSPADPLNVCFIRLWPIAEHFVPSYGWLVNASLTMVRYDQAGSTECTLVGDDIYTYTIESYDVWNHVVALAMDWYEPEELKNTCRIEYHSMAYDNEAHAFPVYFDGNPECETDRMEAIADFVSVLTNGEKMAVPMAASDAFHLRFVLKDGNIRDVYLQKVLAGDPMNPAPKDDETIMYARMGAFCYRIDREAIDRCILALEERGL